ncbi:tRNA (adenosine(37)-N6)-dimethylallyltransferase MiaA [Halalkalibacter urbisdiaboli]|uniref:tRNA (adenosine(37)-N6)-dimethylallyltransferase MiaA n=1 Tax=Halalkalibacter urbisdiaboli TaxID=1960589 RepID=UPI000B431D7D|nr:tRNA (adenosine(37)-N6)-dimethylallyltransferase MiaA [Halalkalibacter urbisdiaboli]
MKEKLIVIVGPTAVGKTALGVYLAKAFNGEVISGDSMQVYKGMDIGTAKVTDEERQGVPHYLIDIKEPEESFSVAEFQERCIPLIQELNKEGKLPFLVGGTGLYVNAVIHRFDFTIKPVDDVNYRKELEAFATKHGNEALYQQLRNVDPKATEVIHPNNVRRVIRALEVYHVTGVPFSEQQTEENQDSPYDVIMIGLTMDREMLYQRINERVDLMIKSGLIEEVKSLKERGIKNCQSVQAIGYKEIYDYLDGNCSKEEAIETLKQNSRRYAKRQLTWFRNKADATWFDMTSREKVEIFSEIRNFVEGKLTQLSK